MFLVFRALTAATLAACLFLVLGVAQQGEPLRETAIVETPAPGAATTIVDIAGSVPRSQIPGLIALAPGERVSAVGDVAVASDLEAGAAIAAAAPASGEFLDLTVDGATGPRRLLVLVH